MYMRLLKNLLTLRKCVSLVLAIALFLFLVQIYLVGQRCDNILSDKRRSHTISSEELQKLKKAWVEEQKKKSKHDEVVDEPPNENIQKSVVPIECLINDNYTVQCLKSTNDDEQVYMPFEFLAKYFEVYGKMKHYDGYDRFEFTQSNFKVCVMICIMIWH